MKNVQDMDYEEFLKHVADQSFHYGIDGMLEALIDMIDKLIAQYDLNTIPGQVVAQTIRDSCEIAKLEAAVRD